MNRFGLQRRLRRADIPAHRFRQPAAGEEQPIDYPFIQMAVGRGHRPAAFGSVQHFRHGQHANGGTLRACHCLITAGRQIGFRPGQAVGAVAIADALEAPQNVLRSGAGLSSSLTLSGVQ